MKYYIIVLIGITVLFVGAFMAKLSPGSLPEYKQEILSSLYQFPDKTIVRIQNGKLTVNNDNPIFIWVKHQGKPFFVILANAQGLTAKTRESMPYVYFRNDGVQLSLRDFNRFWMYNSSADVTLSREYIPLIEAEINSLFPTIVGIYYAFTLFVLPLAFIVFSTLAIIASSALTYMLLHVYFSRVHFKKCLQAGLHGTHIPLLISAVLFYLYPLSRQILPLTLCLFFVFTLVSSFEMYSRETPRHRKGR